MQSLLLILLAENFSVFEMHWVIFIFLWYLCFEFLANLILE